MEKRQTFLQHLSAKKQKKNFDFGMNLSSCDMFVSQRKGKEHSSAQSCTLAQALICTLGL